MSFLSAAIGAGTSILGGVLGSKAASEAAQIQAQGATTAGNLAQAAGQQAQGYQEKQLGAATTAAQPYTTAGAAATGQLSDLLKPGGYLSQTWNQQFQAPTAEQAAQTPGYQFTLGQGINALNRGAAARGNLLSSGAAKALEQYGTGLANQTYNDVYNRAAQQYQMNYQSFLNNQAGLYGRLMGVSGQGLTAVGQLNQLRQQAAENYGRAGMWAAGTQGQDIVDAAQARAQGVMGAANAWRGALSGVGGAAMDYGMINRMYPSGGGGGGGADITLGNPGGIYGSTAAPDISSVGAVPSWSQFPNLNAYGGGTMNALGGTSGMGSLLNSNLAMNTYGLPQTATFGG